MIQVEASDADFGENARLTYTIERGSFNAFRIDSETGLLSVNSKLDFDMQSSYSVRVSAVDNGSPRLSGTATILISVDDRNNKFPRFDPVSQHAEVNETATSGTEVWRLKASDPDAVEGSLRFSIEATAAVDKDGRQVRRNNMYRTFFIVDPESGSVKVNGNLDRSSAAVVILRTKVSDSSSEPEQEANGTLTITILDVNTDPPYFDHPWTKEDPSIELETQEEQPIGSVVGKITASHLESGIDRYEISPVSPYFGINPSTGVVTNKQRLDYEINQEFNFVVVAYDTGVPQLSSTAQVTVRLQNVNDHSPVFSKKSYSATIPENSPAGTEVVTVLATDDDHGNFGQVSYSVTGDNAEFFQINASGTVSVRNHVGLDRERTPTLTLLVAASNQFPSVSHRITIVPVEIVLSDENDNAPKFLSNSYRSSVAETVAFLSPPPIVQVTAIDKDIGLNSELFYNITNGNDDGLFRLDPWTGIMYPVASLVGRPLEHTLVVEVRDQNGTGATFDAATVTITIQSVNQHKPRFLKPSVTNATVHVPENAKEEAYTVLVLEADDADPGVNGRISYHIRVGERLVQETPEFYLDAPTGLLRTKLKLDREVQASYELLLVAKDQGVQVSYETLRLLTVIVDDENDNEPQFPSERRTKVSPYHFRIEENVRPDTAVGQVQAFDLDAGLNAKIYYHIIGGNEGNWFYIDRTHGFVYNRISLDREQRSEYDLLVQASNDPMIQDRFVVPTDREKRQAMVNPNIAQVHIQVVDINDNPPLFDKDTFYAGVDYSRQPSIQRPHSNKFLLQIHAGDPDEGVNGTLSYFIRSSNLYYMGSNVSSGSVVPSPFRVTTDGKLFTDSHMTEYNQHRFVLEVVAREEAPPYREDSAEVHVWVYKSEQLAKIVIAKPLDTAVVERETFGDELRNATDLVIVIDEFRHHIREDGSLDKKLCDVFVHGVQRSSSVIMPVADLLYAIDRHVGFLKLINNTDILAVVAAKSPPKKGLEPAIVALITLLSVLFVGFFMVIFTCCCIRHWEIPQSAIKPIKSQRQRLVVNRRQQQQLQLQQQQQPPPPSEMLNSTENPLWVDKYAKPYEEQELTMRIASDSDSPMRSQLDQTNPYATIQKPRRALPSIHAADDPADSNDYATLESPYRPHKPAIARAGPSVEVLPAFSRVSASSYSRPFASD